MKELQDRILKDGQVIGTNILKVNKFISVVSPFLAFLIWYARGRGALAIGISSVLIAIFCCFAFNLNFADFRILYFPEFILWLASIGILFKDVKQSAFSLLISIPVALSLEYTGLLGIIGIG